jgi:lipopolysaccharide biosynthesis glycosyltransferase
VNDLVRLVVGFDSRETIAYHVFSQSVLDKTSLPVSFLPLVEQSLAGYQETHCDGSNRFTYTRFLTPLLMDFKGWAVFADGDMVCRQDIARLWALRDPTKAVQVVKHDYLTKSSTKYLGNKNENYPRKNWSSLVLWNCGHPANACLTPEFVASKNGAFLHRFQWLEDAQIGELDKGWNWLAIEYDDNPDASLIHYTLGTPCFDDYRDCASSEHWHQALADMLKGIDDTKDYFESRAERVRLKDEKISIQDN